jgi:hypothetical protein
VDEVHGFDLSRFNTIVSPKQFVSRNDLNIELLTDDTCAFFFDFVNTDRFPQTEKKTIEVTGAAARPVLRDNPVDQAGDGRHGRLRKPSLR